MGQKELACIPGGTQREFRSRACFAKRAFRQLVAAVFCVPCRSCYYCCFCIAAPSLSPAPNLIDSWCAGLRASLTATGKAAYVPEGQRSTETVIKSPCPAALEACDCLLLAVLRYFDNRDDTRALVPRKTLDIAQLGTHTPLTALSHSLRYVNRQLVSAQLLMSDTDSHSTTSLPRYTMVTSAIVTTATPSPSFSQSPSVEDLLSARSKRSVPVQSFYSTFATATEIDLPEAARLAMHEEAANGVWSPSMTSPISEEETYAKPIEVEGTQAEPGPATPTMSESQYSSRSRSPSMASVKVAAVIKGGPARAVELASASVAAGSKAGIAIDDSTSPKRLLNSRNLQINTALSAVRSYPQQLMTPSLLTVRGTLLQESLVPSTSRSLPEKTDETPPIIPSAPLSAIPLHLSRPRRRSSLDSFSTLSSPVLGDDDTLGLNQASVHRMQSFLGPKMKHISPAPWNNENINDVASDYTSESSFWNDDDPEIGSVHMATKTPRSRSMKEALGLATSTSAVKPEITTTGTLKGLGLAATATTSVPSPTSRPSVSSERSVKARTATASSDTSMYSGKASKIRSFLSRSESRDVMASPPPPLPVHPVLTVSNITRSKSPEPSTFSLSQNPFHDLTTANSCSGLGDSEASSRSVTPISSASSSRRRSLSNVETTISKLATSTVLSSSTPPAGPSTPASAVSAVADQGSVPEPIMGSAYRSMPLARRRPPIPRQDTNGTSATMTSSDSHTVLPALNEVAGAIPIPGEIGPPSSMHKKADWTL